MSRQKNHSIRSSARNLPENIISRNIPHDPAASIQSDGNLTFFIQACLQFLRIFKGHRKSCCLRRSRDILGIQSLLVYLSISADLNSDQRFCPFLMGLIHRKINPPFIPLVDLRQHNLSCHILIGIIFLAAFTHVNNLKCFCAFCHKIRLISTQLNFLSRACCICIG